MEADSKDGETTIGPRIKKWLRNIGRYLGKEGVKAGVDVAKQMALKWLMQHAGARSATQSAFRLRCNE
jgi:hypothetical protein